MTGRDAQQIAILNHCEAVFGEIVISPHERAMRFGEEAIELLQATGLSSSEVTTLVHYVYGRPVGEVSQEISGTMVTLQALAACHDLSVEACEEKEIARFFNLNREAFRAKHTQKKAAGV